MMPANLRLPLRFAALVSLYLAAAVFADQFISRPGTVTLFWPAAGLSLAAVVRYGLRWAWFVPVAILIGHLVFTPVPPGFIVFSMASNLLGTLAGGCLVLRAPLPTHVDARFGFRALRGGVLMAESAPRSASPAWSSPA